MLVTIVPTGLPNQSVAGVHLRDEARPVSIEPSPELG
jgi:hypothetical protein